MKLKQMVRSVVQSVKKAVNKPVVKKVAAVGMALCVCAMSCVTCFAAEGDGTPTDIAPEEAASQVFTMISEQLNFTTILAVLGVVILAALGMALGWWAIRKVSGALMKAFRGGKFSI